MAKKETTYELRCICVNCGHDFKVKIPKGVAVVEDGTEARPRLFKDNPSHPTRDFLRCPNCDTLDIRKRLSLADMK